MTEYEKYQLQWMISHGYSLKALVDKLTQIQYGDPEDIDKISTPVSKLFDEWVTDVGFGSDIWSCEAEWKDCEAIEVASMKPKHFVICVKEGGDVQLVKSFDTYEQANDFIGKSAVDMYDKIHENPTSDIDVWRGGAEVVNGEEVYSWQIYPLIME